MLGKRTEIEHITTAMLDKNDNMNIIGKKLLFGIHEFVMRNDILLYRYGNKIFKKLEQYAKQKKTCTVIKHQIIYSLLAF